METISERKNKLYDRLHNDVTSLQVVAQSIIDVSNDMDVDCLANSEIIDDYVKAVGNYYSMFCSNRLAYLKVLTKLNRVYPPGSVGALEEGADIIPFTNMENLMAKQR